MRASSALYITYCSLFKLVEGMKIPPKVKEKGDLFKAELRINQNHPASPPASS